MPMLPRAKPARPAGFLTPRGNASAPRLALAALHPALLSGEECPCPGGFPKGDGKVRPCKALTPCGTELMSNTPATKLRTMRDTRVVLLGELLL